MGEDIPQWLDSIGLGQYAQAFADNGIDIEALPHLRDEDFERLGVLLGHMRRLQAAIETLSANEPTTRPVPPPSKKPEPRPAEAERRQLTVMFCDLVGSTALSERLDPEDLRDVLRAYQRTCAEAIERYDGHIAQYAGDGLLVYFGYPQAHEDDAARAVRAGLALLAGIERLDRDLRADKDIELAVRLGIHTGLVVVGEMGAGELRWDRAIVGETPNVAARIEALAEPNSVLIGARTHELVVGLFVCEALGPQRLKGISEPVPVYRVRAQSRASSRFEASVERGMTPLVGRTEEIGLLLERWEQAKDGEGQVVLLSGEAGIGKSRILRDFRDRLEAEPHSRVLYYCSPYHQNSAFHPVIDQMERALRFQKDDDPAAKLDKLDAGLADLELPTADLGPLLAALFSLPVGDRYPDLALGPEQMKKRTMAAAIQIVTSMARRRPVLMVVEDAHWLDPTTQEFLSLAVDEMASHRVLLFVAHRPEFEPPWHAESHVTALALNRLSRKDSAAMIGEVTGGKGLPEEVLEQILAKTDGVPLFIEELTKAVLESGLLVDAGDRYTLTGPLPPLAIPASLQDSLMARLDRLAPVKEVAQLAAMLGRVFSRDLLGAVSPLDQDALEAALSRLVGAGLIYRHGFGAGESYEFKHALVQDTAYQSLLKSTRQKYHLRIAEVLAQSFPQTAETEPEILAHHYTEAQLIEKAVEHWHLAGTRAIQRSANLEAIAHLTKGLELIDTLPDTVDRAQKELALRISMGAPLIATKGYAAQEVERTYNRAKQLCKKAGDTAHIFPVLRGLWNCHLVRAELKQATDLARHLLRQAQSEQEPSRLLMAHRALGTTLLFRGQFPIAKEHFEHGIALYDPEQHSSYAVQYGEDPGIICCLYAVWSYGLLGYTDQALTQMADTIATVRKLRHPFSEAFTVDFAATLHQLRREPQEAQRSAEKAITISTEHGIVQWLAHGIILRGWALAAQGQEEDGISQIHQGMTAWRETGAKLHWPYFLTMLSESYCKAGKSEEALPLLSEAQATAEKNDDRFYEAELHRINGEVLLALPAHSPSEAEASFHKSIAVARRQSAKTLELRAATSLARLWQGQSKHAEARELLEPVYDWFTEGFDTPDLKDAKALLDKLT